MPKYQYHCSQCDLSLDSRQPVGTIEIPCLNCHNHMSKVFNPRQIMIAIPERFARTVQEQKDTVYGRGGERAYWEKIEQTALQVAAFESKKPKATSLIDEFNQTCLDQNVPHMRLDPSRI